MGGGVIDACREFCKHRFVGAGDGFPLDHLKVVDNDFLDVFMPYELRLAQRRAMVWGADAPDLQPNAYIGLYLVRLEPAAGVAGPPWDTVGRTVSGHTMSLLRKVLRDSDIPAVISDWEFMAVLRDAARPLALPSEPPTAGTAPARRRSPRTRSGCPRTCARWPWRIRW
jgi:hypothetical protein